MTNQSTGQQVQPISPPQNNDSGIANKVSQDQSTLEDYWNELQSIWLNIDQRESNLPGCCKQGNNEYKKLISERRLFQFLSGLDVKYDSVRRDILKETPIPSVDSAFSTVRKEANKLRILESATNHIGNIDQTSSGEFESGFGAPHHNISTTALRPNGQPKSPMKNPNCTRAPRMEIDKMKLFCTHCGMQKHTKNTCFRIIGYPEWWNNNHKGKKAERINGQNLGGNRRIGDGRSVGSTDRSEGRAMIAVSPGNGGGDERVTEKSESPRIRKMKGGDQCSRNPKRVGNPNADPAPSQLRNAPAQTSLNGYHGQNQDIGTGDIIGRGTERNGLYYVDEITKHSTAMLAHNRNMDKEAWLWHRRLGHPSLGLHLTLVTTATVCCWMMWAIVYLAQMNPLIVPVLNEAE